VASRNKQPKIHMLKVDKMVDFFGFYWGVNGVV
jgi:hypothetical protein